MTDKTIIEWSRVKKLVDEWLEQRKATIEVYHYFPDHLTDFILTQLTLAESRGEEKARKEFEESLQQVKNYIFHYQSMINAHPQYYHIDEWNMLESVKEKIDEEFYSLTQSQDIVEEDCHCHGACCANNIDEKCQHKDCYGCNEQSQDKVAQHNLQELIHDAPSVLWRIYDLVSEDKVFEAEQFVYDLFDAVRASQPKKKKACAKHPRSSHTDLPDGVLCNHCLPQEDVLPKPKPKHVDPKVAEESAKAFQEDVWEDFAYRFCVGNQPETTAHLPAEYLKDWIKEHFLSKKDILEKLEALKFPKDNNSDLGAIYSTYNQAIDKAMRIIQEYSS